MKKNLLDKENIWAEGEKSGICSLKESKAKELKASIRMSRLIKATEVRSNLVNSVMLLSSISGKKTEVAEVA